MWPCCSVQMLFLGGSASRVRRRRWRSCPGPAHLAPPSPFYSRLRRDPVQSLRPWSPLFQCSLPVPVSSLSVCSSLCHPIVPLELFSFPAAKFFKAAASGRGLHSLLPLTFRSFPGAGDTGHEGWAGAAWLPA